MKNLVLSILILFGSVAAFGAGTVSVSRSNLVYYADAGQVRIGEKVTVAWTADASDGSVPSTAIGLYGLVTKVVTNPGSTAPTDNYDITCGDPSDTALDIFGGALANRDTANTEQVYPVVSGATMPVHADTCTFQLTNNSVNSATGTAEFYVLIP